MPADEAMPSRFSFATASCQHWEDGYFTAHGDIAAAGLDCVFWLGDYIYEGAANPLGTDGSVRIHDGPEPVDLPSYRARYALYKSDPLLQAAHAACPWVVTWDDHEVDNNYADETSQDGAPADAFRARRAIAYRAWWEHQPVRLPPPQGADYPIYRTIRIGTLADVSVLDTRQYRTDQACGDVTLSLDPACPETTDPGRTILGDDQQAWLFERLGRAGTVWNVLAQQVVFTDAGFDGAVLNYDQWDGYPLGRSAVLEHVASSGIDNLVVLSGDIHFAGAANLRLPGGLAQPLVGVEFIDTSISSTGLVPAGLESLVETLGDVVAVELAHRGWTMHTVTADEWIAEYRIVGNALTPGSPMSTWRTFRVVAGTSELLPI